MWRWRLAFNHNCEVRGWLGKFERRAKWNFCLTAAMVAADQGRDDDETSTRNHSPAFEARWRWLALKGEKTLVEWRKQFNVARHQITQWKAQLLQGAAEYLVPRPRPAPWTNCDLKRLHAKIGG